MVSVEDWAAKIAVVCAAPPRQKVYHSAFVSVELLKCGLELLYALSFMKGRLHCVSMLSVPDNEKDSCVNR